MGVRKGLERRLPARAVRWRAQERRQAHADARARTILVVPAPVSIRSRPLPSHLPECERQEAAAAAAGAARKGTDRGLLVPSFPPLPMESAAAAAPGTREGKGEGDSPSPPKGAGKLADPRGWRCDVAADTTYWTPGLRGDASSKTGSM